MEKSEIFQKIKLKWKEYYHLDDDILPLLTKIGYQKYSNIELSEGKWQIFLHKKELDTSISLNKKPGITHFFAIWSAKIQDKKFVVSGMCENPDNIICDLKYITSRILANDRFAINKPFRFSRVLTVENAQDYGYIRGLLMGIILMLVDILPWHVGSFTPLSVLGTFLDYTRIVYYGTPGFAIVVGMAAIGIYFTVLFILLPIISGNLFMIKARRIEKNIILSMPDTLSEYDYGKDAELFLNDQYRLLVENIKREDVYKKIVSLWKNIRKEDFLDLYEFFRGGFITAESLYDILKKITDTCPDFNFSECLRIMVDVMKRNTEVTLRVSET